MARIAGVNIPTNKRVVIALQYIHGIGPKKAQEIVRQGRHRRRASGHQLTDQEVLQIRETIDRDYHGRRRPAPRDRDEHQAADGSGLLSRPASPQGLPVRGQRTHTNARTRKGPAKPIAGKKK